MSLPSLPLQRVKLFSGVNGAGAVAVPECGFVEEVLSVVWGGDLGVEVRVSLHVG
jgi:hypothetical protein